MQNTLAQCERDVEQARARLAQDLAILRSPAALNSFTGSLKESAIDAKDTIVDDLKAKAAANPAATLAIGAGIAWYFVRNPPIAMGLIGVGLYGLWHTNAVHPVNGDYLQQGRERLYEQASDFGASAVDAASEAGQAVSEKAGEMVDAAKQSVQEWSRDAADTVAAAGASVGTAVKEKAESIAAGARRARHDLTNQAAKVGSQVSAATESAALSARQAVSDLSDQVGRASATSRQVGHQILELQPRLHLEPAARQGSARRGGTCGRSRARNGLSEASHRRSRMTFLALWRGRVKLIEGDTWLRAQRRKSNQQQRKVRKHLVMFSPRRWVLRLQLRPG